MPYRFKQPPAVHRKLGSIKPEEDEKVRIIGRVKGRTPAGFVLEDGGISASIISRQEFGISEGDVVRVFAKIAPNPDGFEIHAEIVQSMQKLDMELYKRVFKIL